MPVNTSAIQIEFNQPPPELTRNSSKCTFEFRAEILSLSRKSLYYCRLSLFSPCSTVYISISCPYDRFSCIDDEYYDNGWDLHFLNRLKNGKIDPPFKYEAFLDNEDIIATLEGYELDVEKFWFVLLFIYDMTMDRALSSAEFRKSDYEVLTEIKEYLEKHANARLYLSDDREIPKDNRCETNNPVIIGQMLKYVKRYLARFERRPEQKEWVSTSFHRGFDKSLSSTHQQVFMYNQFKTLFDALKLPEKRAKKGETVSYSKMLLASRLIYFCRITKNESFTVDSSSLKGVLKDYANYPFDETPKVYR